MKKNLIVLCCSIVLIKLTANPYKIVFNIKGFNDTSAHLANYYGSKQFYSDTALVNNGKIIFKGDKPLEEGVYSLIVNNQIKLEFLFDGQDIEINTDTIDYFKNVKVVKSDLNKWFYEYQQKMIDFRKNSSEIRGKMLMEKNKNLKEQLKKELEAKNKNTIAYKENLLKKLDKNSMLSLLIKTLQDIQIPNFEEIKNDSSRQIKKFNYAQEHFFDQIDFSDSRLVRFPVLDKKIDYYFKNLVFEHPDSVNKAVDFILKKAMINQDLYRFLLHKLTKTYEESKIMGMDGVKIHLYLNYFGDSLTPWIDSTKLYNIKDYAKKEVFVLIGKKAPNITLADTSGKKWINLYKDVKADYTVLIFWRPTCSHCKVEIPKIKKLIDSLNSKRIAVVAVSTYPEKEWKDFIKTNNINFINLAVPAEVYKDQSMINELVFGGTTDLQSLNFKDVYNILSTPEIFLLDKDKVIIGKKLESINLKKMLLDFLSKK